MAGTQGRAPGDPCRRASQRQTRPLHANGASEKHLPLETAVRGAPCPGCRRSCDCTSGRAGTSCSWPAQHRENGRAGCPVYLGRGRPEQGSDAMCKLNNNAKGVKGYFRNLSIFCLGSFQILGKDAWGWFSGLWGRGGRALSSSYPRRYAALSFRW